MVPFRARNGHPADCWLASDAPATMPTPRNRPVRPGVLPAHSPAARLHGRAVLLSGGFVGGQNLTKPYILKTIFGTVPDGQNLIKPNAPKVDCSVGSSAPPPVDQANSR